LIGIKDLLKEDNLGGEKEVFKGGINLEKLKIPIDHLLFNNSLIKK
jgi:hypothetical protein